MFQPVYPSGLDEQRRGTQQGWPAYDDSKSEHPTAWPGSPWDNDTLCKLPLSPTKQQMVFFLKGIFYCKNSWIYELKHMKR